MSYKSLARSLIETHELRAGGIITEAEIRALRLLYQRVQNGKASPADNALSEASVDIAPMRVEDAQAERSVWSLRKLFFRKDHTLRDTMLTQGIGPNGMERIACVLNDFDHFMWVDFEWQGDHRGAWYARYKCVAAYGESFEYTAIPWQSGKPVFHVPY